MCFDSAGDPRDLSVATTAFPTLRPSDLRRWRHHAPFRLIPDDLLHDLAAAAAVFDRPEHAGPAGVVLAPLPVAGGLQLRGVRPVQIGRAHVCTPFTNAHLVCRLPR